MKKSADFKNIGRSSLEKNWSVAILVSLIVLAISTVLNTIPIVGTIASLLLVGQLTVGEYHYYTRLVKKENPTINTMFTDFTKDWISNFVVYLVQTLYLILWTILFIIPGIIKSYSYAMTTYLKSKEPNLGTNEAITKSRKLMDGNKWRLFCLDFSFLGWIILSCLTFGIGFIFLIPYMNATRTAFFEEIYTTPEVVNETTENKEYL